MRLILWKKMTAPAQKPFTLGFNQLEVLKKCQQIRQKQNKTKNMEALKVGLHLLNQPFSWKGQLKSTPLESRIWLDTIIMEVLNEGKTAILW